MATDPTSPLSGEPNLAEPGPPTTQLRSSWGSSETVPLDDLRPSEAVPLPPLQVGALIGDYELVRQIATGGMGSVWEARDTKNKLNLPVALKTIKAGEGATEADIQRFLAEARAVASLHSHPHIVKIYALGNHGDQYYIVMQLVRGGGLKEKVRHYRQDRRAAARLMIDVADAISHAHRRGILHRDLKPDNILIDDHGNPFVTDFGLAKRVDPTLASLTLHTTSIAPSRRSPSVADEDSGGSETQGGTILGTPSYMPPEQAKGLLKQISTLSDVYGLGATLYELLTGRPPFVGQGVADILGQVIADPPQPPHQIDRTIDKDLDAICLKCLQKDPKQRYESAEAFARDLDRWLVHKPVHARSCSRPERLAKWARREPWQATIAALTVVLLALALFALVQRQKRQEMEITAQLTAAYEEGFRKSTRTVDALVNVVESEIGADLAMQPLRRRLLQLATDCFQDAISQWERDPDRLDELAGAHAKLAEFAAKLGDEGRAQTERGYAEAIRITQQLLDAQQQSKGPKVDRRALEAKLAGYYHELGIFLDDANDLDRALEAYSHGLKLRQELCLCARHKDPTCFECLDADSAPLRAELGRSHGYLGDVYINQGQFQQAAEAYQTSHKVRLDLFRKFATHTVLGDEIKFQLARSYGNLAAMARYDGDLREAIKNREQAATLLRQLLDKAYKAPSDRDGTRDNAIARYLEDDASTSRQIGVFLVEDGRFAEAVRRLEEARAQFSQLVTLKPGRLKSYVGMAGTLLDRAIAHLKMNELDLARNDLEQARESVESTAGLDKDRDYQVVKARLATISGQVALAGGHHTDALDFLEAARGGWQDLVSRDGQRGTFDDFSELGEAMAHLGLAHERAGHRDEAISWLISAIEKQHTALEKAPKVAKIAARLKRDQGHLERLGSRCPE
jgi:serine/threonine protein kinase/tetratricopeptide (TPR) repeat protein